MVTDVKIILFEDGVKFDFYGQDVLRSYNAIIDFCMDKELDFYNDESVKDLYSIYVHNPTYKIMWELIHEIEDDYTIV